MTSDEPLVPTNDEFWRESGSDLPLAEPPPATIPPGMQYHDRIGLYPTGCNTQRELAALRNRLRGEQQQQRWRAEYDAGRAAQPPEPPPLTLETLAARVVELERQVEALTPRKRARRAA